jgi:hypothetical protein
MKETPRRRITVTSSLNEISKDQMGNRVVVRRGYRCYTILLALHSLPPPLSTVGFWADI